MSSTLFDNLEKSILALGPDGKGLDCKSMARK
jgi:hypothetical protein